MTDMREAKKTMDNIKEEVANLFAQERVTRNTRIQRETVFPTPFVVFYIPSRAVKQQFDGRSTY
jgi:hypothetical protein